jgi:hypothetical protein
MYPGQFRHRQHVSFVQLWKAVQALACFLAGARAQLVAEQVAATNGGITEQTGASITGIPSQWNLTHPDPGSGPMAPLNATNSSELNSLQCMTLATKDL